MIKIVTLIDYIIEKDPVINKFLPKDRSNTFKNKGTLIWYIN